MRPWRILAAVFGLATGLALVTLLLASGVAGDGLSVLTALRLRFGVEAPRLVFLREVGGVTNLWAAGNNGRLERLSDEPWGVWDYSPIPDGRGVLLSAFSDDGSLDFVRLAPGGDRSILLDCGRDDCREGRWQPAGDLVAFEKVRAEGAGVAEVWIFDSASGSSWPVDNGSLLEQAGFRPSGRYPRWSSDGRYLSYYHPEARAVLVLDMQDGPVTLIPANLEIMGDWSPGGYSLAYSELSFGVAEPHVHEEDGGSVISHTEPSLYNHVVVADIEREETADLSDGEEVNDGKPAWRPDGEALAVGRTSTGSGRQIWIEALDGSAIALTDDPFANHSAPAWSPDGRQLAFMRSNVESLTGAPAVWLLDLESGEMNLVKEGAFLPGWLPG
jgi:Tol biopolymer transport system component